MKFWEHFNHLDRTVRASVALLAFSAAVVFGVFAITEFARLIVDNPGGWREWLIIPFTCLFAAIGLGCIGWWLWQRSKNTYCVARGCNNPVASLGDTLCGECLRKREQGASDTETTSAEEAEKPQSPVVAAAKFVEAEKPSPQCVSSNCQSPRTEDEKNGRFYWWCRKCWEKRNDKFGNSGKLQCITCANITTDKFLPWCRKCWVTEGIYESNPVKTENGGWVYSRPEKRIADFLYRNNIGYHYDKPLPNSTPPRRCDFFLPAKDGGGGIYIEYYGLKNHPTKGQRYREVMKQKAEYYARKDLIALCPKDDDHLEKRLADELRKRGYKITAD